MNKDPKKICPLLSSAGTEVYEPCLSDRCAWYTYSVLDPSLPPEGNCAIARLADIADGARNI